MEEKEYKWRLPRKWCEEVWFPALLSGKYDQATGSLRVVTTDEESDEDHNLITTHKVGYCCLGVAGVACGIEPKLLGDLNYIDAIGRDLEDLADEDAELSILLSEEAVSKGYPEGLMYTNGGSLAEKLGILNDTEAYTFAEIVNWVKKNVELYEEV